MKLMSTAVIAIIAWGSGAFPAQGQSKPDRFAELMRAEDVEGQRALLAEWRATDANDPELYVAYFNFYVSESRSTMLRLDTKPGGEPMLQLQDPDTAVKEPAGYLYEETVFDREILADGFAYIDSGIARFPQRLDMRFGKIYMHGENKDYEHFTQEIVRTIDHGAATKYAWLWARNEPLEDPENYMYSNVQSYVHQLFETGDDALLPYMIRIGEAVIKHDPDNVESLSTIGAVHVMQGDLDKGLIMLLRAEKVDGKDGIVLGNIAQAYLRKGDTREAISYYERMLEVGDEESKAFARAQLKELRK
jgi:tetratricopeptide (TPR) repeat protein